MQGIYLSDFNLEEDKKNAIIGFHAFTGNDYSYTSSFFKKGKKMRWKVMEKKSKFVAAFTIFGTHWNVNDELFKTIQEFDCCLCGQKCKTANTVRYKMFFKKKKI